MRTLYYVKAGTSRLTFYLDRGHWLWQTMEPDSLHLAPCWLGPASTILISLRTASRKDRPASPLRCVGMEVEYERD